MAGAVTGTNINNLTDNLGDMMESIKGFKVNINTFLYQLVWDEEAASTFYQNHFAATPDEQKRQAFEQGRGAYKLKYAGKVESKGNATSFMGIKETQPELMVLKACTRAIDENIADLGHDVEAFRVRVPLLSTDPITAPIGMKEGINKNSKFEVLEVVEDVNGKRSYKRAGVIQPIANLIWDNRFMAQEESAIGANLGMKYYFLMRRVRLLLEAREKENLRQQLENLRYQISPHLFMNTLNNIHALVDINPEEAKQSIVTLSRIMRFILYDGAKNYVHLANSVELLRLYTDIMRMRYSDKVKLQFSAPDDIPSSYMIPPLLIIPLLGNAYKHGVSYKKESFVNFTLEITPKQRLNVTCVNSNHDSADGEHGGVGLTNLRKRLNLIFGHDYSFTVSSTDAVYESVLNIPIHIENQTPESS